MTVKQLRLLTGAIVVSSLLSAAYAFVPTGFRWRLPVRYEVNTNSSQELGQQTTLQVVQSSYTNWAQPACSGYTYEFDGETNGSWNSNDGMNTLVWFYNPQQRPREIGGRATIGVTLSVFRGNSAFDGDILFNGIDHSWTTNAVRNGQVDSVSIITHEVGHQLGLNHSPFQNATMYAAYLGGDGAASLAEDDINGVCDLYPSGADPDCQADDDCPNGQQCVGGSCVDEQAGGGAIGDPCNGQQGACQDGLFCVSGGAGNPFCTRSCNGECPDGWDCTAVNFNGQRSQICLPGNGGGAGGMAGFGDACQSNNDCRVGFCISDGQRAFCSQTCNNDQDCPDGGQCAAVQGGGGACIPGTPGAGMADFGDPCQQSTDCRSQICLNDGENLFCSEQCGGDADCPPGGQCIQLQGGGGACIPGGAPVVDQGVGPSLQPDQGGGPMVGGRDTGVFPDPNMWSDAGTNGNPGGPTIRVVEVPAESGCNCSTAAQKPSPLWLLVVVGLLGWRRRW